MRKLRLLRGSQLPLQHQLFYITIFYHINGNLLLPPLSCFMSCLVWSNCFKSWFISCTVVPEPQAILFLREEFIIEGSFLSLGVIERIIASVRPICFSSIFASLSCPGFIPGIMPKSDSLHKEEAQEFVDFLSRPDIATANMDTIGYTSFIAGDDVLDLVRNWYDPRTYAMYVYHDATLDGLTWEDSDFLYDDDGELVYQDGTGFHDGSDFGSIDMTGSTYEQAVVNGTPMSWDEYQTYYNENVAESEDDMLAWDVVDLTYMFKGTLSGETSLGDTPDTNPYLFYTDELEEIEQDGQTVLAGRQFYAQYPPNYLIPKLAAMKDYADNNRFVLTMWENVKGNNLPISGVVVFGCVLGVVLAFGIAALVTKYRYRKLKVARRKLRRQ